MKSSIKWVIFIGLLAALFVIAACAPKEDGEGGALAGQAVFSKSDIRVISCSTSDSENQITYTPQGSGAPSSVTKALRDCDGTKRIERKCLPGTVKKVRTLTYPCDSGFSCSGGECVVPATPAAMTEALEGQACVKADNTAGVAVWSHFAGEDTTQRPTLGRYGCCSAGECVMALECKKFHYSVYQCGNNGDWDGCAAPAATHNNKNSGEFSDNALFRCQSDGWCYVPPTGIVAWWRGEGTTESEPALGTIAYGDVTATSQGVTLSASGEREQALNFDGAGDYLLAQGLTVPGNEFTIEGWIFPQEVPSTQKGTGTVAALVLDIPQVQKHLGTLIVTKNGDIRFQIQQYFQVESQGFFQQNAWTHIAGTFQAGTPKNVMELYVNGVSQGTKEFPWTPSSFNVVKAVVGARSISSGAISFFKGRIDELTWYNRVLTATEIKAIVNARNVGKCSQAVFAPGGDSDGSEMGGVPPGPVCQNAFNYDLTKAELCPGDDQELIGPTNIGLISGNCVANNPVKCEYKCLDGFQKSGNACVAITTATTAAGCTGGFPQVSTLCSGDGNQPLPVGITYSLVDTCTNAVKCERTCNAGYVRSGTNCVTPTSFKCTGSYAAASTLCSGDNNGLAADTAYTLVDTCTTAVGCERTCNPGYKKSGTSCKKVLGQTCTSRSQCLSGKCTGTPKKCTALSTQTNYVGDCGAGYFCNAGVNACELPSPGLAKYCGASYTCRDADGYGPLTAACQYQCPTGAEICDGCDNDGDALTDEDCDDDNDDYCDSSMTLVGTPAACPLGGGDCNDWQAAIRPGVADSCFNAVDDNCDNVVNPGCAPYSCTDQDPTDDPTLPRNITLTAATGEVYHRDIPKAKNSSLWDNCPSVGSNTIKEVGCALESVPDFFQVFTSLVKSTTTACPESTTCLNTSMAEPLIWGLGRENNIGWAICS